MNDYRSKGEIGERFVEWAKNEPTIQVVVQIGSRVRPTGGPGAADAESDWDFQVVAEAPAVVEARATIERAVGRPARALVARGGRLGSARKVTAVFDDGALDVVVIPAAQLRAVQDAVRLGQHKANPMVMRGLLDLAAVLVGGYRMVKGDESVGALLRYVTTELPVPRIGDAEARELAEGFVCDYVATRRLIGRGELVAAQRWLHLQLAETNLRLLHELLLRRGAVSFPDGRRLESVDAAGWAAWVAIEAKAEAQSLDNAVMKAAGTCRELMQALVGETWCWPALAESTR